MVGVVVVAGGGAAWAATRHSAPAYRTATVSRATVHETVTEVGTIGSVSQRAVSFPVSGTVASVGVKVGDSVSAGDVLARLDRTALRQALQSDRGSVASAKQQLATDEATEQSSATESAAITGTSGIVLAAVRTTPSPGPSTSAGGSGSSSVPTGSGASSVIAKDQAAVVAAQAKVDSLLTALKDDLAGEKSACASSTVTFTTSSDADGVISGTISGAAGLPVSLVDGTDAAGASVAATTVGSDGSYGFGSPSDPLRANATYTVQLGTAGNGVTGVGSCQSALVQVQSDEQGVATAEKTLASAEQTLDDALAAAARGASTGSSGSGSSGSRPTGSTGTSGSVGGGSYPTGGTGSSGLGSSSSSGTSLGSGASSNLGSSAGTITAASLAADQKAIDAAKAQVVVARQQLDDATLTAPINGTVADVAIATGDAVSAGSSSATITIVGTGQKEVTTTIGIDDVDSVKEGDTAHVTIDGVSTSLTGKVTEIGVMNTSGTSGTTTTYPVTVLLDPTSKALYDGAGATVSIDVGTARDALTVPTSAVHSVGRLDTVTVLADGRTSVQRVTVGIAGDDRVQIRSGLKAGQQVVLANLDEAVPSSDSSTTGFGGGTFGGGTFGGGTRPAVIVNGGN